MNALSLPHVVEQIRRLPSPPAVVAELLRDFQGDDIGIAKLAGKISTDQALSAAILRLANSSFYGVSGHVGSVQRAGVVLGMNSLRTLTIAAGIAGHYAKLRSHCFNWRNFWQHAFAAAICARELSPSCGQDAGTAFTAGLVHDIGRLALVTLFPAEYESVVVHSMRHRVGLLEAERLLLGLDHAGVGAALAQRWNLPPAIQQAIANHHQPDAAPVCPLTDLVHVADVMTQQPANCAAQPALTAVSETVCARLHIDAQQIQSCADAAVAGAQEMAALMLEPSA